MEDSSFIPTVDMSVCNPSNGPVNYGDNSVLKCVEDVCAAFSRVGFVYLINHGIPQAQIDEYFRISKSFFDLPEDTKQAYTQLKDGGDHGYVGIKEEKLNPKKPADLKESYNVKGQYGKLWPDAVVPGFREKALRLFQACTQLSWTILEIMARGLYLQDPEIFSKNHSIFDEMKRNSTTLRSLHYPPVPPCGVEKDQLRCGEHADYGSITLLFQDDAGGLEVRNRDGVFVPATPVDGAVLVNIGDLMQRWTADRLVSTRHRVTIPSSELSGPSDRGRQSVAFFVNPDNDCMIRCVDGSDKYEPIRCWDYLLMRSQEVVV